MALSCCTGCSKVLAALSVSQSFLTVITHGKDSQFSRTGEVCISRTGEVCTMDNRLVVVVVSTAEVALVSSKEFKNEKDPTGPSSQARALEL